jgi:hypothetical protein
LHGRTMLLEQIEQQLNPYTRKACRTDRNLKSACCRCTSPPF